MSGDRPRCHSGCRQRTTATSLLLLFAVSQPGSGDELLFRAKGEAYERPLCGGFRLAKVAWRAVRAALALVLFVVGGALVEFWWPGIAVFVAA
jgi:hypothetical protein